MLDSFECSILFVGAGKMGGAILAGLLENGLDPALLVVQDPSPPVEVTDLLSKYEISSVASAPEELKPGIVILSVKPQIMDGVLAGLAPVIAENTLILSIAAGKTLENIGNGIGSSVPVVRAMPNTPAEIGRAITVMCPNRLVSDEQRRIVDDLMSAVGETAWIENESDLDAVTALSGSGPAYVFFMTECMAQAGIDAGLDTELAWKLAKATVSGASELMRLSELHPSRLRENVTSPGGTTAAALEILMSGDGLKPLMSRAIAAAGKRAGELSG